MYTGREITSSKTSISIILSRLFQTQKWPFQCTHASIILRGGSYDFIWPIYDCCSKCEFPAFTTCLGKSKNSPDWLCPSQGLHCIVNCVNKNNPSKTIGKQGISILPNVVQPIKPSGNIKPGVKPRPVPKPGKPILNKCEKMETENGKKCIRRLCIPLSFKP